MTAPDATAVEPLLTVTSTTMGLAVAGWILFWCGIWGWFLPAGRRRLDADDASAFFAQLGWLWPSMKGTSCLGIAERLMGQSRVPLPPAMIIA